MTTKTATHRCLKCGATFHEDEINKVGPGPLRMHPDDRHEPEAIWFCPECGARENIVALSADEAGELAEIDADDLDDGTRDRAWLRHHAGECRFGDGCEFCADERSAFTERAAELAEAEHDIRDQQRAME